MEFSGICHYANGCPSPGLMLTLSYLGDIIVQCFFQVFTVTCTMCMLFAPNWRCLQQKTWVFQLCVTLLYLLPVEAEVLPIRIYSSAFQCDVALRAFWSLTDLSKRYDLFDICKQPLIGVDIICKTFL